jgi:hypothetical protein
MTPEERLAAGRAIAKNMDWHSYDYTTADGADMSFPDFADDDLTDLPVWLAKHFNKTSDWSVVHVADLNIFASGAERKLYALYGVPVAWPRKDEDADGLNDLLDELDAAREKGGKGWAKAMDKHGLLADEHFLWMRHRSLGTPDELKKYATAQTAIAEIDAAIEADDGVDEKLEEYGLRDRMHYEHVKGEWSRASKKAWGKVKDVLANSYAQLDERMANNKKALSNELSPFQGVSLEAWAGANARLAQGKSLDAVSAELGLERPQWDAVSAEWMARMSRDTTATIATVYGEAFMSGGQGKFAATAKAVAGSMKAGAGKDVAGGEPISFEDWIKIQAHMTAATAQGVAPDAVLKMYKLNAADWGTAGGYWALKMNADPMSLLTRYTTLSAKYATKFASAGAAADIDL